MLRLFGRDAGDPVLFARFQKFGKIVILGEFLAASAVVMCVLFIFSDMGQPTRVLNIFLHPTPTAMVFWDTVVLNGYLFLNIVIGWVTLGSDRKGIAPPAWIKPFIYLSIPWAISIHTVTAFLYAGLPGRHFWLTAVMAARFPASAFAAGPALHHPCPDRAKVSKFDPGKEAIQAVGKIVAYAMFANIFLLGLEFFTAFYSQIPGHMHPFGHLYAHSETPLVPMMWLSTVLAVVSLTMLFFPCIRKNEGNAGARVHHAVRLALGSTRASA